MKQFLWQIIIGILGLYLAILLIPGVAISGGEELTQQGVKTLFLAGAVLGLINFFIKPIVKLITFPLRLLTFGLFGLVINMAMVWIVDIIFPELVIANLSAIFWTSLIIWLLSWSILGREAKRI
jgi:putative membrane protein